MSQQVMLLRIQLFTAAQQLCGKEADEFWNLIREVAQTEEAMRSLARMKENKL